MTSTLLDQWTKITMAGTSALTDVFLLGGIASINYLGDMAKDSLLPNVPIGMARNFASAGFDAAKDVAKYTLYEMSVKHIAMP
jgi:hypothetical protein